MDLRIPAAVFAMVLTAFAQSEARFEVASVKMSPEHGGTRLAALDTDPAMVRYANLSLKLLIAMAYRFDSELIKGGPAWLDEQHYDVAAKLPPGAPKDRVPEMMQALLAERFKLAVHRETKDARIYYLVAGKGGPKLKKSDGADAPDPDHVRGDRTPASLIPGGVIGHAITVQQLAGLLGHAAGYRVVDHTGLAGNFDVNLRWRRDDRDTSSPDLFAAIQEQLGLKLEPAKGSVEVLIVDHAERIPTEN